MQGSESPVIAGELAKVGWGGCTMDAQLTANLERCPLGRIEGQAGGKRRSARLSWMGKTEFKCTACSLREPGECTQGGLARG